MAISYKKLWKLLIDRDMKKKDLMALAGVSQSSITKMGHNDNVNTEVLVKICLAPTVILATSLRLFCQSKNKENNYESTFSNTCNTVSDC